MTPIDPPNIGSARVLHSRWQPAWRCGAAHKPDRRCPIPRPPSSSASVIRWRFLETRSFLGPGSRAIVGALGEVDPIEGYRSGAAYIYELDDNGDWIEVVRLIPALEDGTEGFAAAVSISGDYAVVGAPFPDFYTGPGRAPCTCTIATMAERGHNKRSWWRATARSETASEPR